MLHEVINNYSNEVKNRLLKSDNLRSSGKAYVYFNGFFTENVWGKF